MTNNKLRSIETIITDRRSATDPTRAIKENKFAATPSLKFPLDIEGNEFNELTQITILESTGGKWIEKEPIQNKQDRQLASLAKTFGNKPPTPTKTLEHISSKPIAVHNIYLPMPPALATVDAPQWEGVPIGALGAGIVSGKFGDIVEKAQTAFKSGPGSGAVEDLKNTVGSFTSEVTSVIARETINGLSGITGANVGATISLIRRDTVNPRQEVIFQGLNFRDFNFSWRMQPTSESELNEVINIIRTLKYYAAPDLGSDADGRAGFFLYPAIFDIKFLHKIGSIFQENIYVPKIARSVVTGINVNYTASGLWTAFKNGAPTDIQLDITFRETELITKKKVDQGF